MRHAFDTQNELGQLCDEAIYHSDLLSRLNSTGIPAVTEAPVTVSHRDFSKTYLLDLIVENTGIYELKTASRLTGSHETQLLNYLFLCGVNHGKLLNFRPAKIEARFVNTTLTQESRRQFTVDIVQWTNHGRARARFRKTVVALLEDWGCWLDVSLYTEALIHLFGGETKVRQLRQLRRGELILGTQPFLTLDQDECFRLTVLTQGIEEHREQLSTLMRLGGIQVMHWVNLDRSRVQFITLRK